MRAQVVHDLEVIALIEGDIEEAERLCRRLMEWPRQPGNTPKEALRKARLSGIQESGAGVMMGHWAEMHVPKAQRRAKIEAFVRDYAAVHAVGDVRARVLEYLAKSPDVPAATGAPPVNRAGQYAAVIVVVLLALATIPLFRSAFRRRT
ncbi:MAG: hypothetical protein HYS13_10135, partial [Planctomycetia bacterium]|nr:hypothetical protein [Planctomycetia bacterium]